MNTNAASLAYGGHALLVSVVTSGTAAGPIHAVRVFLVPAVYSPLATDLLVCVPVPGLIVPIVDSTETTSLLHGVTMRLVSVPVSAITTRPISFSFFVPVFLPAAIPALLLRLATSEIVIDLVSVVPVLVIPVAASAHTMRVVYSQPLHSFPAGVAGAATRSFSASVLFVLTVSTVGLSIVPTTMQTDSVCDGLIVLVPATASASAQLVFDRSLSIVTSAIATDPFHGEYVAWSLACCLEADSLLPSVAVVEGQAEVWLRFGAKGSVIPFTLAVRISFGITNGTDSPDDNVMQIDDPDHPMGDDTTQDSVDDLEPAMDVDRTV